MKLLKLITLALVLFSHNLLAQQSVKSKNVPQKVKESYAKEYPLAGDTDWQLVDGNYVALYGINRSVLIDPNGKVLAEKNTIKSENLPEKILTYFAQVEQTETIKEAKRVITLKDTSVHFIIETKHYYYKFKSLGELESKEKK